MTSSSSILCSACNADVATLYCSDEKVALCLACSNTHIDHRLGCLVACCHCRKAVAIWNCSSCKSRHCTDCKLKHHTNKTAKGKAKQNEEEEEEEDENEEEPRNKPPTKEHKVRAIPKSRKPTVPFKDMFASDARIISTRKQTKATSNDQKEDMDRIRSKIKKMLAIANNAGTSDEAKQASQIAATWMAKYQLSQFEVATSGQLEEGDYMIQVRNPDREQTDKDWIFLLAKQVAKMFPCFVKTYYQTNWHGNIDTYCFLGVEDSAWNACELFCELFGIVAHNQAMAKFTRRFVSSIALDSYAYGMVQGMPLRDFVDVPELLRDFSEGDQNKMIVIRKAGNEVVERAWNRHQWSTNRSKTEKRRDYSAMQAGKQDGASVRLSDKRVKRIEM